MNAPDAPDAPNDPPHWLLYKRELSNGDFVEVWRMTFGKARLVLTDGCVSAFDGWCYEDRALAVVAATLWDGTGDPLDGWHRHINSGRRRENGDPTKEQVYW